MNEWLNEIIGMSNEWMNEWLIEDIGMSSEWINEFWMNEWMNEWMNKWFMNGWISSTSRGQIYSMN